MKGATVQIAWHGSEPVLSLDFHSQSGLLATAGADHDIKLWSVQQKENGAPTVTFEADLCYHSKAVNILRFAPSGQLLASGGDGGEILLWKPIESSDKKPSWKVLKTLQLHVRDVLDLAWSPDSSLLMSGSVDNQCMIWDVATGKIVQILNDHQHFVQGVAWDPAGEFLASISSDRTCRIYSRHPAPKKSKKRKIAVVEDMFTCRHVIAKTEVESSKVSAPADVDGKAVKNVQHMFHDETLPSFFRRLAWSPDSSFLLVPSGLHKMGQDAPAFNMSYIFSRKDLSRPCIHLPAPSKPVVAVRFCPAVFSLVENVAEKDTNSGFAMPYRLVFAVATLDSLIIYDTQRCGPIVIFAGIHYAAITDIAWSADAQYVAVSSQDGYCSVLSFGPDELGTRLSPSEVPANVAKYLPETVLAQSQQASIDISTKMSLVPESVEVMDHEHSSPPCPRPLKHRRITPTALSASPLQSVQKQVIVPTAVSVPAATQPQKPRRITPVALAEDCPSVCGNDVKSSAEAPLITALAASPLQSVQKQVTVPTADCDPAAAEAQKPRRITPIALAEDCPSVSGNDVKPVAEAPTNVEAGALGTQEINHTTSSVLEVTSSGPNKRLRITPIAIPGDTPLGPSCIEKISRPSDCDPSKFRSIEACLQERPTDVAVPPAVQCYHVTVSQ